MVGFKGKNWKRYSQCSKMIVRDVIQFEDRFGLSVQWSWVGLVNWDGRTFGGVLGCGTDGHDIDTEERSRQALSAKSYLVVPVVCGYC